MEDEKKKKRNKKKKNKQNNNKHVDDAIVTGVVATSENGNHIGDGDICQITQVPDSDESQIPFHQINVVETVSFYIILD